MNFGTVSLLLPLAAADPTGGCPPQGCGPAPTGFRMPGYLTPQAARPDLCRPYAAPAQVLMVKILAPAGGRTTVFPGTGMAQVFGGPAVLGLRPGYAYAVELAGLPGRPGETLYPEIEVRGTLVPRAGMSYLDYPAAIVFTPADIERASTGSLVTKVIFLEDPNAAVPVATTPDRPHEEIVPSEETAIAEAAAHGRPVMVVRLGNRKPTAAQLEANAVPGTVLFPGVPHLPAPARKPTFGWCGVPLYDPVIGAKLPTEECLTDGGDRDTRLGVGPDGKLRGLDASDVAVEYSVGAKRKVTTSNRVCVCVPRFGVYRTEAGVGGLQLVTRLESGNQAVITSAVFNRVVPMAAATRVKPVELDARVRAMMQIGRTDIHAMSAASKPQAVGIINNLKVAATAVEPEETTNLPNELVVTKSVSPETGVKIGDEVTFTIKYSNQTRQPVTDLTVSDSLTARFEYVPGSNQSDRPGVTTTEMNAAGALVVKFDLPGTLMPGQGGVVKFRARVR